jgi:hypothetical protein
MRPDGELETQDALDALGDLVEWRLTPTQWVAVAAIVERAGVRRFNTGLFARKLAEVRHVR